MAVNWLFLKFLFPVCLILLFNPGCSKNDDDTPANPPALPVLTTSPVTSILLTTAVSGGQITSDGGAPVSARGICWSLAGSPDLTGPHTTDGTGTGTFISTMSNLIPDTVYHASAYATNSKGTAYGNVQTFRTAKPVQETVTDVDGNTHPVVQIGTQKWLGRNLRVTHYTDGQVIQNVTTDAQWKVLTTGAICAYDNYIPNSETYGFLYNYFAVTDSRGICPTGWHVPTVAEWSILGEFLGGNAFAGGKLKSTGTIEGSNGLWYAPNSGATNSSGFSGLPGGYRINYGTFYSIGNVAYFWSSSDAASINAWNYILDANNGELKSNFNIMANGFSVRCCKD